jgi:hypothetical protein
MKPILRIFNEYAVAVTGRYEFRYGINDVDPDTGEWKFTVKKSGKEVFELTNSELLDLCDSDKQSPQSMLFTGILVFLAKK